MTELNKSIFDQLRREGVQEVILQRAEALINELPEPEAFRKMSHDMVILKPLSSANVLHVR